MTVNLILTFTLKTIVVLAFFPIIFLYIIFPILFYSFPRFMQRIFFLNYVKMPFLDYHHLTKHGVKYFGRPFYLKVENAKILCDGKEPILGVWHILPKQLSENVQKMDETKQNSLTDKDFEGYFVKESRGVVVYLHGNSSDRANAHRTNLYNRLADMNFHVLAIDYRGYGDSTGYPTEDGLIEDAHFIYNYARDKAPGKNIYVWGHSMGTGVASRFVAELSDRGIPPTGTILESPFNNIHDVAVNHPYSKPFRCFGQYFYRLLDRWVDSGLVMKSDKVIKRFKCPILVLHAVDDPIIPLRLGKALVDAAKKADRDIKFVEFEENLKLAHNFIHRAPHFVEIVTEFFGYCETPNHEKFCQEVHIDN